MKNRTCIICGHRAGSAEHIFPAALGGRRTNKGIYCGPHNIGYGPLANILSNQFRAINAFLGVRGDHSDRVHGIETTDIASGRAIKLSGGKTKFVDPELVSETVEGDKRSIAIRFSNDEQVQQYLQSLKAQGLDFRVESREQSQQYFLSGSNIRLEFGGPEGLRAIGYVAQTFLAHCFPHAVRDPAFTALKDYTCGKNEGPHVWWDFEATADLPVNKFEFGHRVLIGMDALTDTAYARVSLFSALNFAIILGSAPDSKSQSVLVDIDPLADHPPDDIVVGRSDSARASVTRPQNLTESLHGVIVSGQGERLLGSLLSRIASRELEQTAESIWQELRAADDARLPMRDVVAAALKRQAQRILNLMHYGVEMLTLTERFPSQLVPLIKMLVAFDPKTPNGLAGITTANLELCTLALVDQMVDDHKHCRLDKDRIAMLLGYGPGVALVTKTIVDPVIARLAPTAP